MKRTMLTPKQAKALDILRNNPGCTANTFAALYSGSILGKLAQKELVRREYGSGTGRFYLTFKGEQQISPTNEFVGLLGQKS